MSLQNIQGALDEIKESLTDGAYKKMCDVLKEEYKKHERKEELYQIEILVPRILPDEECPTEIKIIYCDTLLILPLEQIYYTAITDQIMEKGYFICKDDILQESSVFTLPFKYGEEDEEPKMRCLNVKYSFPRMIRKIKKM